MISFQAFRHELRPTIRLALPLVLAEIGWMSMGIVDTVMVGHLPDSAAPSAPSASVLTFSTSWPFSGTAF